MRVAFCAVQTKGKSNGDCAAGHVRVLCSAEACRSGHLRLVLQKASGLLASSFRRNASLSLSESNSTSIQQKNRQQNLLDGCMRAFCLSLYIRGQKKTRISALYRDRFER